MAVVCGSQLGVGVVLTSLLDFPSLVGLLQKQILYAAAILTTFSMIIVLGFLSTPETMGVNTAVALITVLYAAIFEMFLLPMHVEVKRRIIDYMEAE